MKISRLYNYYVDLKLWFIKVVKSDVCIEEGFHKASHNYIHQIH